MTLEGEVDHLSESGCAARHRQCARRREGLLTTSGADVDGAGLGTGRGFFGGGTAGFDPVLGVEDGAALGAGSLAWGGDVHVEGFQAVVVWHSAQVRGKLAWPGKRARS